MFTLENDLLKIVISPKGAELQQIFHKGQQLDYLWAGAPAFWAKHSPVLFPIVGTLKDDTYYFEDKAYRMGRHGFAREMEFLTDPVGSDSIVCSLTSTPATKLVYPFDFRFDIRYQLEGNSLTTTYHVHNTGAAVMYFSVGGHPAFKLPIAAGLNYDDYYLEFNHPENAGRWPISKEGLIETKPVDVFSQTNRLPLTKALFQQDALVFKGLSSNSVELKTDSNPHGLAFDFTGFPYLGIWAAKNADFVCIEPWCGIADNVNSNQQLTTKEGIHHLQAGKFFERSWSVTVF